MLKFQFAGFFVLIGIATVLFSGCGSPKVTGQVKFEDGTPLTVGDVIFESTTVQARGPLDRSGKFVMGSARVKDGVPPGQYRVYIGGAQEATGEMRVISGRGDTRPIMRSLIDAKWEQPATSGLTCEVRSSTTFNITVTRP